MKNDYLVYTGNLYPHKNVATLISAAIKLNIPLKIICARSVFENRLPKSSLVQYLGHVSDQEMKHIYSKALAFVFPSFIEGFGLPGLEAMSVGLPVISSNASCLPEVYGDAALYFDPNSVDDLVQKIIQLKSNPSLCKKLITAGFEQIKKYSWAKMAEQTWSAYLSVL